MYDTSLQKKSMTMIELLVTKTKCCQLWLSKSERETLVDKVEKGKITSVFLLYIRPDSSGEKVPCAPISYRDYPGSERYQERYVIYSGCKTNWKRAVSLSPGCKR
jgi:hypothetical protein